MDKSENKAVAVKVEGFFTEWYCPNYKEPFEDHEAYRQYYNSHILDKQPVIGPSLGDADDEFITDDLECQAERMCCGAKDWRKAVAEYKREVNAALADGKPRKVTIEGMDFAITPFTKAEMPPVNEKSLEVYGEYKELIRGRVAAI